MDLNADVGEGFGHWRLGDDKALLGVVTSANVACGFHAGDPTLLRRTCELAAARGVVVGAQVGYRDLAGFGRRFVDVEPYDLTNDVLYQIGALDALARAAGTRVAYVKPHGALYNATVAHEAQAAAVVAAVASFRSRSRGARDDALPDVRGEADDAPSRSTREPLPLLGLPGSALLRRAADAGIRTIPEFFADRAYTPTGTLVPRGETGGVITDDVAVAERCTLLVRHGQVEATDGSVVTVLAESICVHGDTPGAVRLARAARAAIEEAGGSVRAFATP